MFTSSVQVRPGARSASCRAATKPYSTLSDNSGVKVPPIVNGLWTLAGGHGSAVYDSIDQTLEGAYKAGYTAFDTADIYGPSESILGDFVKKHQGDDIQVFTKFVPNVFQQKCTPALVEQSMKRSMNALKMSKLDLVQMHWWDYKIPGMVDAALTLQDMKAKGVIKSVGMTNMNCEAIQKMLDAGVEISVNQVQFSLLDRRPLNGMVQLAQKHNMKLLTYGSVGGGLLSDRYYEEPKKNLLGQARYSNVDLNTSSLKMYFNIARMNGGTEYWRQLLAALKPIADKHKVSIANVALRWVIEKGGGVVHPIVGLRNDTHFADNDRVLSFTLDAEDHAAIDAVLATSKGPAGDCYSFERGM